jgi:hypothetical protein
MPFAVVTEKQLILMTHDLAPAAGQFVNVIFQFKDSLRVVGRGRTLAQVEKNSRGI